MIRIQTRKGTGLVRRTKNILQDYLTHNPKFSSLPVREHMDDGLLEIDTENSELASKLQVYLNRKCTSNAPKVQFIQKEELQSKIDIPKAFPEMRLEYQDDLERKVQELTSENQRLKAEFEKFSYKNNLEDFNKAQLILYKHSQAPRFQSIIEKLNDSLSLVQDSMTMDDIFRLVMNKGLPFEKTEKYLARAEEFRRAEKVLELTDGDERFIKVDEVNRILSEKEKLKKQYEEAQIEIDIIKGTLKDELVPYLLILGQDNAKYTITITTPLQFKTKEGASQIDIIKYNNFELSFINYIKIILERKKTDHKAEISVTNTKSLTSFEFSFSRKGRNPKDVLEQIAKDVIEDQKDTLFHNLGIEAHVILPISTLTDGYIAGLYKRELQKKSVRRKECLETRQETHILEYAPLVSYGLNHGLKQGFENKISKKNVLPQKLNVAIVAAIGGDGDKKTLAEIRGILDGLGIKYTLTSLNNALYHLKKSSILIKEGRIRNTTYKLNHPLFR